MSFPIAISYIYIGYVVSEYLNTHSLSLIKNKWYICSGIVFLALNYIEQYILISCNLYIQGDIYLFTLPIVLIIVLISVNIDISSVKSVVCRELSIVIYTTHMCVSFYLKKCDFSGLQLYFSTIIISIVIYALLKALGRKNKYIKMLY